MRVPSWVVWGGVAFVVGCRQEAPPPPPPAPPPPPSVRPAPAKPPEVPRLPEPPTDLAAFPEPGPPSDDVTTAAALARVLLADPNRAERLLSQLPTPDGWQVSILSEFALARGDHALRRDRGSPLPDVPVEGRGEAGVGPAFVAVERTVLTGPGKKAPALASLEFGTPVEVLSVDDADGGVRVSVALATRATWGAEGTAPEQVETKALEGQLPREALTPRAPSLEQLVAAAKAEPDDAPGRERAVVHWRRALQRSHGELAREGLLRAAVAARRAPEVVEAALAMNLAPVRAFSVATACRGDRAQAKWLPAAKPPAKVPEHACFTDLDLREACADDVASFRAAAEARAEWRRANGVTGPAEARFVVDARSPRLVFLVKMPLQAVDPCADFEEFKPAAWEGTVRRLHLPLGGKALEARVALPAQEGVEYAIVSAANEAKALRWLQSRSRFKWSLGPGGQLRVSLSAGDLGFQLERDVTAVTWALRPPRTCTCD